MYLNGTFGNFSVIIERKDELLPAMNHKWTIRDPYSCFDGDRITVQPLQIIGSWFEQAGESRKHPVLAKYKEYTGWELTEK